MNCASFIRQFHVITLNVETACRKYNVIDKRSIKQNDELHFAINNTHNFDAAKDHFLIAPLFAINDVWFSLSLSIPPFLSALPIFRLIDT